MNKVIVPIWWQEAHELSVLTHSSEDGFELSSRDTGQHSIPNRFLKVVHFGTHQEVDAWVVTGQIRLGGGDQVTIVRKFTSAQLRAAFTRDQTGEAAGYFRRYFQYLLLPDCGYNQTLNFNFSVRVTPELEEIVGRLVNTFGPLAKAGVVS